MRPNSKILVTGGKGFIGQHLLSRLSQKNYDVTVIDHSNAPAPLDTSNVRVVTDSVKGAVSSGTVNISSFDCIFHHAGNSSVQKSVADPLADLQSSVEQTIHLLQAMRETNCKALLIFPSSAAVYGEPSRMPIQEGDPTVPVSPYGVSKLAAERYIDVFSRLYSLRSVSLRPFSVYGPGQRKQVVYDIIRKLTASPELIEVLGDGNQQRDFIYVDDLIDLMLLCSDLNLEPGESEVFNAATGSSTTILKLVMTIAEEMQLSPKLAFSGRSRLGDPHAWTVDITKAKNVGFSPTVSLALGIRRVLAWFKEEFEATNHYSPAAPIAPGSNFTS